LLVENTAAAIAKAIRRVCDDRSFAGLLAVRARQVVEERFSVAAMVAATEQVYKQVLSC